VVGIRDKSRDRHDFSTFNKKLCLSRLLSTNSTFTKNIKKAKYFEEKKLTLNILSKKDLIHFYNWISLPYNRIERR